MSNEYVDLEDFLRRREMVRLTGPKVVAGKMTDRQIKRTLTDNSPGDAKSYVHYLLPYCRRNNISRVIIYARVSSYTQAKTKNLETQVQILREQLEKRSIEAAGCYREEGSGREKLIYRRWKLIAALQKACELDIPVVAISVDRFIRNQRFHSKYNPNAIPTEGEFMLLKRVAWGVPLLTLLPPEMPLSKVKSYQTRWAMRIKKKKGGRPRKNKPGYKKQRRRQRLETAQRLYKRGMSVRKIAEKIRIAKSTVADWCKGVRRAKAT